MKRWSFARKSAFAFCLLFYGAATFYAGIVEDWRIGLAIVLSLQIPITLYVMYLAFKPYENSQSPDNAHPDTLARLIALRERAAKARDAATKR